MYRAHQGRPELQAARGVRRQGTPPRHAAQRGADERLQGRGTDAAGPAPGEGTPRRQGLRRRLVRQALAKRKIAACIPSKSNRKIPIEHDRRLYRERHKIENMFGKLKDWRRIHTRYDRCAHTFFSAICIAAIVIFWINQ